MKKSIENYLKKNLGVTSSLKEVKIPGPIFLKSEYRCFKSNLFSHDCLFVCDKNENKKTPLQILKHFSLIRQKVPDIVIYVNNVISHKYRDSFIEYKIPFMIPNNHMYIPHLAIEVKEYFKQKNNVVDSLTPSAQSIVIYALLNNLNKLTALEVEENLNYSRITISRAFRNLESLEIADCIKRKGIVFKNLSWEVCSSLMTTPVIKTFYAQLNTNIGLTSGETALAEFSMLSAPEIRCVAIYNKDIVSLQKNHLITECESFEDQALCIESWSYNPKVLSSSELVDKLSLSLTMKDTYDERILLSIKEMLEGLND